MAGSKRRNLFFAGAVVCVMWTPHAIGGLPIGPVGVSVDPYGPRVPLGRLGSYLGQYVTIEGVRAEEGAFLGTRTLLVDTINGKKLDKPIHIWVNNLELPTKKRCVFKGYESGEMIGRPPAVHEAAKEQGRTVGDVQAGWQWHPHFVALIVVEPKGLEVPKE